MKINTIENNLYTMIMFLLEQQDKSFKEFVKFTEFKINQTTLSNVTLKQLSKMAKFFNVTPDYLINENIAQNIRNTQMIQRNKEKANAVYDTAIVFIEKHNNKNEVIKDIEMKDKNISVKAVVTRNDNGRFDGNDEVMDAINSGTNIMFYIPQDAVGVSVIIDSAYKKQGKIISEVIYANNL